GQKETEDQNDCRKARHAVTLEVTHAAFEQVGDDDAGDQGREQAAGENDDRKSDQQYQGEDDDLGIGKMPLEPAAQIADHRVSSRSGADRLAGKTSDNEWLAGPILYAWA